MDSGMGDVLEPLSPLLDKDTFTLLQAEAKACFQQAPGSSSYEVFLQAIEKLRAENKISTQLANRLSLAIVIAKISGNNQGLITAADQDEKVQSLRDFAIHFDTTFIQNAISTDAPKPGDSPSMQLLSSDSGTDRATRRAAETIRTAVFNAAPTPTVLGMVMNDKLKLSSADANVKTDLVKVLSKLDDTAIGTKPISSLPKAFPAAFKSIPVERQRAVSHELKTLSRVASIAPTTTAARQLMDEGITTSSAIARTPKDQFVAKFASTMTPEVASATHSNAVDTNIRNENMLVALLQLVKGTGLQVIDGQESPAFRKMKIQELATAQSYDLNFESLFGSNDECVCDECTTVYSLSSYFVDILQYLRCSTDPASLGVDMSLQGQQPSLKGTVLEKLFKRRPDLGNLQLSCENTNTVLPYIDLANEVMESYIVHLDSSAATKDEIRARQVDVDVYNVGDQDSSELLAQPQNTNYDAYQALAAASYPLTLPYHQPIDAQRAFLDFLNVHRVDLLDAFRPKPAQIDTKVYPSLNDDQKAKLQAQLIDAQDSVLERQIDAETLGLVQEEYIILTGEAFFNQTFFNVTENITLTTPDYQKRIGFLNTYSYWGYSSEVALRSTVEADRAGLQFVKQQFLPRSGIAYSDLVKLVETAFLNPLQPTGRDKTIFDQLQFSYRFLQTLVDNRQADQKKRLGRLAEFLVQTTNVIHLASLLYDKTSGVSSSKSSKQSSKSGCVADGEVRNWVFNKFESLGKIIVLDSGEGPRLPIEGQVFAKTLVKDAWQETRIGYLSTDGAIKDFVGLTLGNVTIGGRVLMGSAVDDVTTNDQYKDYAIDVRGQDSVTVLGVVQNGYLKVIGPDSTLCTVEWVLTEGMGGGCNIDNVRLTHLDGTSLSSDEWYRFQQFIRLWRRLGWSVSETDMALTGLTTPPASPSINGTTDNSCGCHTNGTSTLVNGSNTLITFDNFTHGSTDGSSKIVMGEPQNPITPDVIHELAAIKKLIPLTGLPIDQLLTFWTTIPTRGSKSLYARLFFIGNIRSDDPVFGADVNGDYFTSSKCTISDHVLPILAAFGLKVADIGFLLGTDVGNATRLKVPVTDLLNIANLSKIFRYSQLADLLGVQVSDMGQVLAGFDDPFESPNNCLGLLQTWNKMAQVGFSWPELRYVAADIPSDLDPLAPDTMTVLQTAKTLNDGILAIQQDHRIPGKDEDVPDELVSSQAALIFDDAVVTEILQHLDGKTVYLTDAPSIPQNILAGAFNTNLQVASAKKATYIPQKDSQGPQLQVTGILSDDQVVNVKGLLDPDLMSPPVQTNGVTSMLKTSKLKADANAAALYQQWEDTVDRSCKQPRNVFYDSLVSIFPPDIAKLEFNDNTRVILAPDITDETAKDQAIAVQGKTPTQKRRHFLQYFIPFLQDKLARVLVEDTITSAVGFNDRTMAQTMLDNIAIDKTKSTETAMDYLLKNLKQGGSATPGAWSGYLAPLTGDSYVFTVSSRSQPPPMSLDGKQMPFYLQQQDPTPLYSTVPPTVQPKSDSTPLAADAGSAGVKLESGKLYRLQLVGVDPSDLQWKGTGSTRAVVPSSAFLPDPAQKPLKDIFMNLQKLAIVVNNLKLSSDEVVYIYKHPKDFHEIDFMHILVSQWVRLQEYVEFRDNLPSETDMTLIELFNWAVNNPTASKHDLVAQIAKATTWKNLQIGQTLDNLLLGSVTSAQASNLQNAENLAKFTKPIALSNKLGVEIPRPFAWTSPLRTAPADFTKLHNIAEDIQKVARSRYSLKTWPDAVKPINDGLRESQKNALISYLLVQDEIRALDIYDADGLFEYFLIDTQMTPLVETSRMKQAVATVQVYVQRCLLGLEEPYGVPVGALNPKRWDWMSKYRVWEANRQVFLYPENWIDPSLRDDKSDFFQSLESELLQKDLDKNTISSALKGFLYNISEISNMMVVGLCQDYTDAAKTIHIFTQTRTAPYSYYHNTYASGNWGDWKAMTIEIPNYTADDDSASGKAGASGVYFAPLAFNKRVVVFIPQIMKKTKAADDAGSSKDFTTISNKGISNLAAKNFWEVKFSWTEFRNGAWAPRQLCPDGFIDTEATPIDGYIFIPTEVVTSVDSQKKSTTEDPSMVKIFAAASRDSGVVPLGEWHFTTGQLTFAGAPWRNDKSLTPTFGGQPANPSFTYDSSTRQIHSLQAFQIKDETVLNLPLSTSTPSSTDASPAKSTWGSTISVGVSADPQAMYHGYINELISASNKSTSGDDSAIFTYLGSLRDTYTSQDLSKAFGSVVGDDNTSTFNELSRPFSLYNWELGLHAPMLLVDRLHKAQQFDQALAVCHYVFDPMAKGDKTDMTRFWVFGPFKFIKGQALEAWFEGFKVGEKRPDVQAWRDNPFAPHVVARSRLMSYMKWMVMKYIQILIDYGDYYFRQNTLETIPNAIQMYIMASHLYGPRGQKIKKPGKVQPYTYNSLLNRYDAFSNAMVQMEDFFPFSNQTPLPVGKLPDDSDVQMANVFGFAATLYFTIPSNPNLAALGDTIDDRLFKIRHSQDINGVFRQLPLFEPPIDPGLLVQAAAQGLSLSSVLTDLNGPMPNYRFQYLLSRALELASEVKSFGQALISARERQDSESYEVLRASHESVLRNLMMETKKLALDEANGNLEALKYSRNGPVNRMTYWLKLAGEDTSSIPGADAEFQELDEKLHDTIDDGDMKLISSEKEELNLNTGAAALSYVVNQLEAMASGFHALPSTGAHGTPLGCGVVVNWGPPNIGYFMSGIAKSVGAQAGLLTHLAGVASRKATFQRSLNERLQHANAAGYEISHIDKQITATQIRVAVASKDVEVQQKSIDQARNVEDFLRQKYTNADLYSWVFGQTKTLYYQTYTQAYDLAKKVEKLFKFERPQVASTVFIQAGYWNASKDGLLAGENLYYALKQLEATYMANRGYDYEITKNISLRQIDPMALLRLRAGGECDFSTPEILYDMDFPGHYLRRIKSVHVTIPCVVGPYASVNATLKMTSNRYRTSPTVNTSGGGGSGYAETESTDTRFATTNVPILAIAVSSGQTDAGVFDFQFTGDRYLPFEGAGAAAEWSLSLPPSPVRPFDYGSIADVILTVRYTSVEGGSKLADAASGAVRDYVNAVQGASDAGGLYAIFDLRNEFATSWARLMAGGTEVEMGELQDKLPLFAVGRPKGSLLASDIYVLCDGDLPGDSITVVVDGVTGKDGSTTLSKQTGDYGGLVGYVKNNAGISVQTWKLQMPAGKFQVKRIWVLVRYTLKKLT